MGLGLGVSHCVIWCKGFMWVNQNVTSTLIHITCWTAVCPRLSLPDAAGSVKHLVNNNPFHLGECLLLFKALLPLYLIWSLLGPGKHFPFCGWGNSEETDFLMVTQLFCPSTCVLFLSLSQTHSLSLPAFPLSFFLSTILNNLLKFKHLIHVSTYTTQYIFL